MRIKYASTTGECRRPYGRYGGDVLTLTGDRDQFINICLALVLAILVFFMLLSIYLVVTKPISLSLPTGSTYRTGGGAAFAAVTAEQLEESMPLQQPAVNYCNTGS